MNRMNFLAEDRYPLSTQALDFMQQMIDMAAQTSALGGDRYILSGCVETGNNVSEGLIVVNKEIIPLHGGTKGDKITIINEKESILANGIEFPDARVKRYAIFASGEGVDYLNWNSFKRIKTNITLDVDKASREELATHTNNAEVHIPKGLIVMWSGALSEIPKGWALCNGVNGTPNLCGRFIVGYYAFNSDYNAIGKTGGKDFVTLNEDQMPQHRHLYTDDSNATGKFGDIETGFPKRYPGLEAKSSADRSGWGGVYYTSYTGSSEAHENRPPYYVLAYIMKL